MANVKFYLDKRKGPKKDGTYPLKFNVTHRSKVKYIPLQLHLKEKEWSADAEVVTSKHPKFRFLNSWLFDQLALAKEAILETRMKAAANTYTVAHYAAAIDFKINGRQSKKITFAERLQQFAALKKPTTARLYDNTLTLMRKFDPHADSLTFEDIDRNWLIKFNNHLAKTSNSQNYRNIHLRNIRAVFNDAIDDEVTTCYPFRKFKIKAVETEKRSFDVEQLRELFQYPLEDYQREYVDMFKLMFLLCGINAIDLFHLKELKDGRAVFYRAKTGKLYSLKVEPEALEIIQRWKGKSYLLSVCDRYKDHRDYTHRMNLALQRIGKVERHGRGGKKKIAAAFPGLTTYWARHTWATIAAELDVPDAVISQALGHAPTNRTTEIYIRRNHKKVDEANRRIIDWVFYNKK